MHELERPPDERRAMLEEEPTTELIKDLFAGAQTLLREEVVLAKIELLRELERGKAASKAIGLGATFALIALMLFAFTLVALLSLVLAPWIAGAIVALIFGAASSIALSSGMKTFRELEPSRALDRMKEEAQWIKKTMHDIQSHKRESNLH